MIQKIIASHAYTSEVRIDLAQTYHEIALCVLIQSYHRQPISLYPEAKAQKLPPSSSTKVRHRTTIDLTELLPEVHDGSYRSALLKDPQRSASANCEATPWPAIGPKSRQSFAYDNLSF